VAHVERRISKHLEPYFGGRRLANITTDDVAAYVEHRQGRGAANATINREVSIVKRAFRLAQHAGKVFHAPAIAMLDEDNARAGFFDDAEFTSVRNALPDYLKGVATLGYLTGWRKGEILGLTWASVDRRAKVIRLEPGTTKNKKARTLPYDALPELAEVIAAQWQEHRRLATEGTLSPWVFSRSGERIGSFVKAWKAACKAAGCPGKLFHDFRRSAVRNLVRAGVSEHTAMAITGHKTRSVFDRYDIVNEADLRAGLGKLAEASEHSPGDARGAEKGQTGRVRQMPSS
jgi:integrase